MKSLTKRLQGEGKRNVDFSIGKQPRLGRTVGGEGRPCRHITGCGASRYPQSGAVIFVNSASEAGAQQFAAVLSREFASGKWCPESPGVAGM